MNSEAETTVIGARTQIKGDVTAEESLTVLGRVEGSIRVGQELTIESSGLVVADVEARSAAVHGMIVGNVSVTDLVHIVAHGRVVGDVRCRRIVMEEGAALRGAVEMGNEQPRLVRNPAPSTASSVRPTPRPSAAPEATRALRPPPAPARAEASRSTPPKAATADGDLAARGRGAAHRGAAASSGGAEPAASAQHAARQATTTREKAPRPPTAAGKKSRIKRR